MTESVSVATATADAAQRTRAGWVGPVAAAVSMLLIGSSAPVASTIRDVPLLTGQSARYLIAATLLIIVLAVAGRLTSFRPSGRDLVDIALLGVFGIAGFNIFLVSASYQIDPALVGTILAATPVLLAVVAPLLARRRPAGRVILGAILVATGTAFTTGTGAAAPTGILLCLGALACELAFTLLAVRLIRRFGSLATTLYAAISGAIVLTAAAMIFDGPAAFGQLAASPSDVLGVLYLAIAVAIGANAAWYLALPRLGPDRSGLFYAFSPIGALAASFVLGASLLSPAGLAGLVIVAIGLVIGVWPRRRT